MVKLGQILNNANIPFIWDVFTNDTVKINNLNIFYREPTLNISNYICNYDYLVQLSDNERIWIFSC